MAVPARLRALPPGLAGCDHLAHAGALDTTLRRYAAALRWGRQLEEGKIRPRDATDDYVPDKRRRVRLRPRGALACADLTTARVPAVRCLPDGFAPAVHLP